MKWRAIVLVCLMGCAREHVQPEPFRVSHAPIVAGMLNVTPTPVLPRLKAVATPADICVTLRTGICCTDAAGTTCAAPEQVCAHGTTTEDWTTPCDAAHYCAPACTGAYPVCAGSPHNDGIAYRNGAPQYPVGTQPRLLGAYDTDTIDDSARDYMSGEYSVWVSFLDFHFGAVLPTNAYVTRAYLHLHSVQRVNTNGLDYVWQYYRWTPPVTSGDWTDTPPAADDASVAYAASISTWIAPHLWNILPLRNPGSFINYDVNPSGWIGFRYMISQRPGDAPPTGQHQAGYATYNSYEWPGPQLEFCYVLTVPPTPCPSPVALKRHRGH